MSITVFVDGLPVIRKCDGAFARATLPDICRTPIAGGELPLPYPNVAFSDSLIGGSGTVTVEGGHMAAVFGSQFSESFGDEPGVLGGIFSGTFMGEATWLTFSLSVRIEGRPVCRHTDKMLMNHGNTVCMGGVQRPDASPLCLLILQDCEEGRQLFSDANKANGGKSPEVKMVPKDTLKRPAALSVDTGTVFMDQSTPLQAQVYRLSLELGNLINRGKAQALDELAKANKVTEEEYVKGMEQIEYDAFQRSKKVIESCGKAWESKYFQSDADKWDPEIKKRFEKLAGAKTFDEHFALVDQSHKNLYIRQYWSLRGSPLWGWLKTL